MRGKTMQEHLADVEAIGRPYDRKRGPSAASLAAAELLEQGPTVPDPDGAQAAADELRAAGYAEE